MSLLSCTFPECPSEEKIPWDIFIVIQIEMTILHAELLKNSMMGIGSIVWRVLNVFLLLGTLYDTM